MKDTLFQPIYTIFNGKYYDYCAIEGQRPNPHVTFIAVPKTWKKFSFNLSNITASADRSHLLVNKCATGKTHEDQLPELLK